MTFFAQPFVILVGKDTKKMTEKSIFKRISLLETAQAARPIFVKFTDLQGKERRVELQELTQIVRRQQRHFKQTIYDENPIESDNVLSLEIILELCSRLIAIFEARREKPRPYHPILICYSELKFLYNQYQYFGIEAGENGRHVFYLYFGVLKAVKVDDILYPVEINLDGGGKITGHIDDNSKYHLNTDACEDETDLLLGLLWINIFIQGAANEKGWLEYNCSVNDFLECVLELIQKKVSENVH